MLKIKKKCEKDFSLHQWDECEEHTNMMMCKKCGLLIDKKTYEENLL